MHKKVITFLYIFQIPEFNSIVYALPQAHSSCSWSLRIRKCPLYRSLLLIKCNLKALRTKELRVSRKEGRWESGKVGRQTLTIWGLGIDSKDPGASGSKVRRVSWETHSPGSTFSNDYLDSREITLFFRWADQKDLSPCPHKSTQLL